MIDYKNAKGWLRDEERFELFSLALNTKPGAVIVNIGVEYGASLSCLKAGNPDAMVIGIDLDLSKVEPIISRQCQLREGDSGDLIYEWAGLDIDLLFIDGDHSYEGVKSDIEWLTYMADDGVVVFHDCYDFDDPSIIHKVCPGVNEAVEKWRETSVGFEELDSVGTMRIFRRAE